MTDEQAMADRLRQTAAELHAEPYDNLESSTVYGLAIMLCDAADLLDTAPWTPEFGDWVTYGPGEYRYRYCGLVADRDVPNREVNFPVLARVDGWVFTYRPNDRLPVVFRPADNDDAWDADTGRKLNDA